MALAAPGTGGVSSREPLAGGGGRPGQIRRRRHQRLPDTSTSQPSGVWPVGKSLGSL